MMIKKMARAICEQSCEPYPSHAPDHEREYFYASMTDGFIKHASAACASVRPEDVTDEMVSSYEASLLRDNMAGREDPSDKIRRAIAAAINAAGSKSPAG